MSHPLPVMFRAGRVQDAGARAGAALAAAARDLAFTGNHVLLADLSEFQPDIADAAYLAWSRAVVIRAMYGSGHVDAAWYGGARRSALHDGGALFTGIYQYVAASQDAAAQAAALVRLLGSLRAGEVVIADIEEGAGSQEARWEAWAHVIRDGLGDPPWNYAGEFYAAAHGIAPVDWVAAYQSAEPSVPHRLWQFTDSYPVPGVGKADCSVFHGTVAQLAALAHGGAPAPTPAPAGDWTSQLVNDLPEIRQGATGEDARSVQGLLIARGYPVAMDGVFGPGTRAAVAAFQHAKALSPDGTVGPVTWPKLLNL